MTVIIRQPNYVKRKEDDTTYYLNAPTILNYEVNKDNGNKLLLKWQDPDDTTISGEVKAKWSGTQLIRKTSGYPTSPSDGYLIVDSKTKNQYRYNNYVDSNLSENTTYYYTLYSYDTNNRYSSGARFQVTVEEDIKLPPNNPTIIDYKVGEDNASILIKWSDPENSGDIKWNKTVLVRKTTGYPSAPTDGTVVLTTTTRDQYRYSYYTDSNLSENTTYYYKLFAYSTDNLYSSGQSFQVTITEKEEINYPPSNPTIINHEIIDLKNGTFQLSIKWKDPDDTVLEGSTIVKWSGTKLVRKNSGFPSSYTDGSILVDNTIRNNYQSTAYIDEPLQPETTYYYALFAYSDKGLHSDGVELSITTPEKGISSVLEDNDWETIIEVANRGEGQNYWQVGDEKTLELSGTYNMTITLQIWGFNHFDKSDESGKANICFGCKDIYIEAPMSEEEELIDLIYYSRSTMDEETTVNIYNSILEIVRNAIKEVTIEYNRPEKYTTNSMSAKVFIPSNTEVSGNGLLCTNYRYLYIGEQLAIFTDNASKIKNDMIRYGTGKPASWWTRTLFNTIYDPPDGSYMFVSEDGDINASYNQTHTIGAVFCFNI